MNKIPLLGLSIFLLFIPTIIQPAVTSLLHVIPLTDPTVYVIRPVWSPDGKKIAFKGPQGIYVVNSDGSGNSRRVISGAYGTSPGYFAWASDSEIVCLGGATLWEKAITKVNVETFAAEKLISQRDQLGRLRWVGDGMVKFVTQDGWRAVSKDGGPIVELRATDEKQEGKVVYTDREGVACWIMNPDGSEKQRLSHPKATPKARYLLPKHSSASRKVLIRVHGQNDIYGTYIVSEDGEEWSYIEKKADAYNWSPDGQKIIYQISEDGHYSVIAAELYIANSDGTEKIQITHTPDLVEQYPAWSPDGKRIAFTGQTVKWVHTETGKTYDQVETSRIYVGTLESEQRGER